MIEITPLRQSDRSAWQPLAVGYNTFYERVMPDATYDHVWRRLMGRLRVDDVETRLRAAREGRGVAQLLSYQVADELAAGKLVRLLQAWEAPPLPVHLVTKGRAHRAPKIDAFVEFAANRLKALPVLLSGD